MLLGTVFLTGLLLEFLPGDAMAAWFRRNAFVDAFTGALSGSIAAGHPVTSYVLGGELLERGVSLVAVTAFLVSWVTVGSIQWGTRQPRRALGTPRLAPSRPRRHSGRGPCIPLVCFAQRTA
jgi:hypothetical protein